MKVAREGIGRFVRRLIVSISKDDESLFSSRIRSQKRYRIPPGLFFSFFFLNKRTLSEFNFRSYSPPFFFFFLFSLSWKNCNCTTFLSKVPFS